MLALRRPRGPNCARRAVATTTTRSGIEMKRRTQRPGIRKFPNCNLAPWFYSGDVNLEHGGAFFKYDESDWRNDYMDQVAVTDLDSACGFDGAVLVERFTILRRKGKEGRQALECCGQVGELRAYGDTPAERRRSVVLAYAECLASYGYRDPGGDYSSGDAHTFQLDRSAPTTFDGWTAERATERQFHAFVYDMLD